MKIIPLFKIRRPKLMHDIEYLKKLAISMNQAAAILQAERKAYEDHSSV